MLRKVQNSLFKYTTQQIYVEMTKLNFTDANSEPVVEITGNFNPPSRFYS